MSRRVYPCIVSVLACAAFAVPQCVLNAQLINRRPLNGASLGGLSTGTNIPVAAYTEDAAYAEMLGAVRRGAPL